MINVHMDLLQILEVRLNFKYFLFILDVLLLNLLVGPHETLNLVLELVDIGLGSEI
jgi:hypothetical protein